MARPINANAEKTKGRIQEVAAALFADQGPGQVSIRQIAKSAGVSLAMVHHYFGSKDDLYAQCVDAMYEELGLLKDDLLTEAAGADNPSELLSASVKVGFRFARDHRSAVRLVMRSVIDHGAIDDERRESLMRPVLEDGSKAAAALFGGDATTLRPIIQSLVFIIVRYALGQADELALIVGAEGKSEKAVLRKVEDHLVDAAHALMGVPQEKTS